MAPSFAFIGFGEAGSTISESLRAVGVERIATYDILLDDPTIGPAMRAKAEALGVSTCDSQATAMAGADIVFSTVVCKASVPVAEEAARHLTRDQYYLDFNSISPGNKRRVAAAIAPSGARFVEASVMADVSANAHRVPMLLGGAAARDFMALVAPLDFNLTFVQEEIGLASATKMVRSVMMKGVSALYLECMRAAERFGIEEEVLASINDSLGGRDWIADAGRTMSRTAIHAARRADEMGQVGETLREVGIEPLMSAASERQLRWCADLGLKQVFTDGPVSDHDAVLREIRAAEARAAAE